MPQRSASSAITSLAWRFVADEEDRAPLGREAADELLGGVEELHRLPQVAGCRSRSVSPKMYSFIFGFQRFVWWPKCTPASSSFLHRDRGQDPAGRSPRPRTSSTCGDRRRWRLCRGRPVRSDWACARAVTTTSSCASLKTGPPDARFARQGAPRNTDGLERANASSSVTLRQPSALSLRLSAD